MTRGLFAAFVLSACAAAPVSERAAPVRPAALPPFEVGRDTFAFRNLVRSHAPERSVGFANYCIIMARAANQFYRFARFAPEAPPVSDEAYAGLTRAVLRIDPWEPPRSPEARIVIPGYPSLYALSRAREAAVKDAFDSPLLSMIHWRTWRVAFPVPPGHQLRLERQLERELSAGRPVPVLLTNFPEPDVLNHAALVYDYRPGTGGVEFLAYDPNDPANPMSFHFDPASNGFWVAPLPYSPPGRVRAFRLFASPWL